MSAPTEFYPITGIQEGLDSSTSDEVRQVPLRMEVDEWFKSDKNVHVEQRALFFPAFWKLSHMSPQEKISWYQIAGIHGRPYVAWDEESQSKNEAGYCTHNSILFSTWHRPYMLLWEQVIYEFMKEEAENFPLSERASLLESAKSWRFPYWDWALKKEDPSRPGNNVDRLIAIWQVLHPDSWFAENDDQNIDGGNFFIEKLHEDKSTDALHPFHDSSGNYYTSDAIREVAALGYTYKDLEKWLYLDAKGKYDNKKHRRELNPKLLKLYGSSWKAAQASHFSDDPGQNTGVGLMSFDEYEKDPVDLIGTDDYVFDVVYEK
ncbi:hypothetical protein K4K48_000322 [Colletotrichum sp. SAR 10_66]|nr:hypothetical protein K4K51_001479 [Colletotrichum sp. SAR 10_75]KAJ5002260.1 hypothetical protein K4K48_000322 [Colletotrichum sp. SAR 10_66]